MGIPGDGFLLHGRDTQAQRHEQPSLEEMGEASGRLADLSVITADNSRFENVLDIIEDIKVGMHKTDGKYVTIPDRREAIRWCIENAQPGDIIVLAGKGHEDYQEIQGEKRPFDERVVIRDTRTEYRVVEVADWVREDDSLPRSL